jgi:hypothetical protein
MDQILSSSFNKNKINKNMKKKFIENNNNKNNNNNCNILFNYSYTNFFKDIYEAYINNQINLEEKLLLKDFLFKQPSEFMEIFNNNNYKENKEK